MLTCSFVDLGSRNTAVAENSRTSYPMEAPPPKPASSHCAGSCAGDQRNLEGSTSRLSEAPLPPWEEKLTVRRFDGSSRRARDRPAGRSIADDSARAWPSAKAWLDR